MSTQEVNRQQIVVESAAESGVKEPKRICKRSSASVKRRLNLDLAKDDPNIHNDGIECVVEDTVHDRLEHDNFQDSEYEEDSDKEEGSVLPGGSEIAEGMDKLNPGLRKLFNQFLDEIFGKDGGKGMVQGNKNNSRGIATVGNNSDRENVPIVHGQQEKLRERNLVKSPSDTTLYVPALNRKRDQNDINVEMLQGNNVGVNKNSKIDSGLIKKISDFVESLRAESEKVVKNTNSEGQGDSRSPQVILPGPSSVVEVPGQDEASKRAEQAVLQAKKFKAVIVTPDQQGNGINVTDGMSGRGHLINDHYVNEDRHGGERFIMDNRPHLGEGGSDEDFFHLMCHVDETLKGQIVRGEFVELEKLLPKDKRNPYKLSGDGRMTWVHRDGDTFLVPAGDRENKINGIRRWEQAFRVYATIYCGEHQDMSREIWQYVDVINTAAASFVWENVACYDYHFRQLMAFNPQRSWAVTYNQMWNLCLKEHLPTRGGPTNQFQNQNRWNGTSGQNGGGGGRFFKRGGGKNGNDYCWNFNRGVNCKYGRKCRYSYCDSPSHGLNSCTKADKKTIDNFNNHGKKGGNAQGAALVHENAK